MCDCGFSHTRYLPEGVKVKYDPEFPDVPYVRCGCGKATVSVASDLGDGYTEFCFGNTTFECCGCNVIVCPECKVVDSKLALLDVESIILGEEFDEEGEEIEEKEDKMWEVTSMRGMNFPEDKSCQVRWIVSKEPNEDVDRVEVEQFFESLSPYSSLESMSEDQQYLGGCSLLAKCRPCEHCGGIFYAFTHRDS